jgi:hypothetical protein
MKVNVKAILLTSCFVLIICGGSGWKSKKQGVSANNNTSEGHLLEGKNILQDSYPRAFFFRRPEGVTGFTDYETWEAEFERLEGICSKAMNEELITLNAGMCQAWFKQFAASHPEQIVVIHYNGRGRDPNFRIGKFSAAHWVYHPGSLLTQDVSATDEYINVVDGSLFKTGYGLSGYQKNDDIVLVPLDDSGNKIWAEAEQVTLVSINGNELRVDRGKYETQARSFTASKTYVAPHMVEGPWGSETNNLMWYHNFSSTCPKDENGKTSSDILAEEIAGWLSESGELNGFDGIQFDIAPWELDDSPWGRSADIDCDGNIDFGMIDGLNVYGLGVYDFYKHLRSLIGDQKIIVADGGMDDSQRAVDVLNGMEAEGLSAWNHVYKEYSKPLSLYPYWKKNSKYPDISYITHKDKMEGGYLPNRERLVVATAQCLELGINTFRSISGQDGYRYGLPDELVKGTENQTRWLGKPVGEMIQMAYLAEDLLHGESFSFFQDNIETTGCNVSFLQGSILVSSTGESDPMIITLKNVNLPSGDATISFESKARDSLAHFNPVIPRQIFVSLPGTILDENTAERVLNYTGTDQFYPCAFYFREAGTALCDIKIEIEGEGEVDLKALKLVNEPQAICREFENGVVLVNPSHLYYEFDLNELFPGQKFKRLTTTYYNDQAVNDGSDVTGKVTLPPIDGLFLIKDGLLSSESEKEKGPDLTFYPNPAGTNIAISYDADYQGMINFRIFDLKGKVLQEREIIKQHQTLDMKLALGNFPKGIYVCSVETEDMQVTKGMFVRL